MDDLKETIGRLGALIDDETVNIARLREAWVALEWVPRFGEEGE